MAPPFRIALVEIAGAGSRSFLPTGLCYLSAYLKKNAAPGVTVDILSVNANDSAVVSATKPGLIGFTAFTHSFPAIVSLADRLKKELPGVPLVLGGQHLSMAPGSMPALFDFGVLGEGEQTFLELVEAVRNGAALSVLKALKGVQYFEGGKLVSSAKRELISPIDNIPFPDRETIADIEVSITSDQFFLFDRAPTRSLQLTTSRGCPYKCVFCQPSLMWSPFRMHSA
ncbi:MAG: cobalamin-dependent protein, partial [Fibrobacterota bacterium]